MSKIYIPYLLKSDYVNFDIKISDVFRLFYKNISKNRNSSDNCTED